MCDMESVSDTVFFRKVSLTPFFSYLAYRRKYGDKALDMLQQAYGEDIPKHNPHFIMGTMKAHPQTFIAIGILRSGIDPAELDKQGGLF